MSKLHTAYKSTEVTIYCFHNNHYYFSALLCETECAQYVQPLATFICLVAYLDIFPVFDIHAVAHFLHC